MFISLRLIIIGIATIIGIGVAGMAIFIDDNEDFVEPLVFIEEPTIRGFVGVIDGNTITIEQRRVRLFGIDTPEVCQPGYQEAKAHLLDLAAGFPVTCRLLEESFERLVGRCSTIAIDDLSARMVADGFAVDWSKYSTAAYSDAQAEAVRSKRGLWNTLQPWRPAKTHHVCP